MKFTADRVELKSKLTQVGKAVARGSTLPVLEHVLLRAEDESLMLRATNLETGIQVSMPAAVEEEGACTVPHERLLDWIGAPLTKAMVSLTLTETKAGAPVSLRVQCGRNYCTLKELFPEDEAPTFPVVDGVTAIVDADELARAVKGVGWATMPEKAGATHFERTGILLDVSVEALTLVALDGFNLAVYVCPRHGEVAPVLPVVVNKSAMLAVASTLSGEVGISVGKDHVVFRTDDVTLVATTLMGEFPDYETHMARVKGDKVWTMDRAAAIKLVKTVAPFAVHTYGGLVFVHVELSAATKTFLVEGESPDVGDCIGNIRAWGNQAIRFAVSPTHLKRAIGSIAGDELTFVLSGPENPLLVKAAESERHRIVMMPVSVTEVERCPVCERRQAECVCVDEEVADGTD